MTDTKMYFGGIPTKPDVDTLMKKFGVPEPGTLIAHEDLEEIIGQARDSSRYRTVVRAWKKCLFDEHNLDVEVERGAGYRILTPPERVDQTIRDLKRDVRHLVRTHNRGHAAPSAELDGTYRQKRDHLLRFTGKLTQSAVEGQRELRRELKATRTDVPVLRPAPEEDGAA